MINQKIVVKDNFLEKKDFKILQSKLLDNYFPWYFNPGIAYKGDEHYQFIHNIYDNQKKLSGAYDYLISLIQKIKINKLIRIKINLTTKKEKKEPYHFHCDYKDKDIKTSIFYVNTNNGGTVFKDGTVIDSIENRIITFPCTLEHTGLSHTDKKRRIVINLNYK